MWPADAYLEVQQLRYCLAMVARAVSQELVKVTSTPLNPNIRKNLYDMFSTWCDEGNLQGKHSLTHTLLEFAEALPSPESNRLCPFEQLGKYHIATLTQS